MIPVRVNRLAAVLIALTTTGCVAEHLEPTGASAVELVQIAAPDLQRLPEGQSVVVDLTLDDVVYAIDAPSALADARVTIETMGEQLTLRDWLGERATDVAERHLRLAGDPADLVGSISRASGTGTGTLGSTRQALSRPTGGGGLGYTCNVFACTCTGGLDCIDLMMSGECSSDWYCDTGVPESCECIRSYQITHR